MELRLLFLAVCLFGIAQSATIYSNINKCSQKCSQTSESFNYQVGKTYIYNYDSQTKLNLNDRHGPKVDLKAQVKISVLAPCELTLQLTDVKVDGSSEDYEYKQALEKEPLRFSFDEGQITDVCHPDNEEAWVSNLKKGIVSALQVSLTSLEGSKIVRERDVLGDCETKYELLSRSWKGLHIKKTKNMKTCDQRHSGVGSIFPQSYSSMDMSSIHGLPILSNDFVCDIIVDKDIVQHSQCLEKNSFLPLSWSKAGSNVETRVKLVFDKVLNSIEVRGPSNFARQNLLYATRKPQPVSENQVNELLRELCPMVEDEIQAQVPEKFAELVQSLRRLPSQSVERVWSNVKTGSLCRSQKLIDIFGDAMIMDSSAGSVKAIADMITQKQVGQIKANYWLTLLAFASQPTEESIEEALPLLESKPSRQALLGVSSMIHNFCHKRNCGSNQVVRKAVQTIAKQIGYKCRGQDKEIIVALKALRNVGPVAPAMDKILDCASASKNSIRVAAIEALEEVSCQQQVKSKLSNILMNEEADQAEIRIAAYKTLIQCPSNRLVKDLLNLLEKETCAQVGAYITSHLKNAKSSSDPNKQHIREVLQGVEIKNKFPKDIRKMSRNMELSYVLSRMNLGGVLDSDIVYDHGFVPRSVKLNVTLPLFGRSFNVFEIGLRQVGLEDKLTQILGPNGIMDRNKGKSTPALLKELMQFFQSQSGRSARRSMSSVLRGQDQEQLQAAMSVKFDGKTILYVDMDDARVAQQEGMKMMENYEEHMETIKNTVQRTSDGAFSFMILNNEHEMPTSNGVPLKLALNGTVVLGYKKKQGSLFPSMAMEVSAKMGFDVDSSQPGIKWVNTFHSAPAIRAKIQEKNGRPVKVTLDLPKEKVDLLSYKSDIKLVNHRGQEESLHPNDVKTMKGCSGSIMGVKVCGQLMTPQPFFNLSTPVLPLNGPWMAEVSARKTEQSMKGWEFELQVPTEQQSAQVYRVAFNTPGSRQDREVAAEMHLSSTRPGSNGVRILIKTPIKKVDASAVATFNEAEASIKANLNLDQSKDYSILASVEKGRRGRKTEYKPKFQLVAPNMRPKEIAGSITIDQGRKSSLAVRIHDDAKNDFVRGSMVKDGSIQGSFRLSSDIRADLGIVAMRIFGASEKSPSSFSADVSVEYKTPRRSAQKVKLVTKVQNLSTRSLSKITSFLELQMSAIPAYNFHINWNLLYKPKEHLENEGIVMWGNNFRDPNRKIKLLQVSKLTGIYRPSAMKTSENILAIEIRPLRFDYEIQLNGHMQKGELPKFKIETVATEKKQRKEYRAQAEYNHIQIKPLKLSMGALVKYPGREMKYSERLDEVRPNEYQGKSVMQWQSGQSANLDYNYRIKSNSQDFHHEMDCTLDHPSMSPMSHQAILRMSPQELEVSSKMLKGNKQLWDGQALISKRGKSQVSFKSGDLSSKIESNHFSTPAIHSIQINRPQFSHNSHLQYDQNSIDFNTKTNKQQQELFTVNSKLSKRSGSYVNVQTVPYEGRMELNHATNPMTGHIELKDRKTPGTNHKTSFTLQKDQLDLNSKTRVQGKMMANVISSISKKEQSYLKVETPKWSTKMEGNPHGPRKTASLQVQSDSNRINHKTDVSMERGLLKLSSNTEKNRKNVLSLDSELSDRQKSHVHVHVKDRSAKIEANPFGNVKIGKVELKGQQMEHISEIKIKPEAVTLDSKTEKNGRQLAMINGKLAEKHVLRMSIPQADMSLTVDPFRSIDCQVNGPSPIHHRTTIEGDQDTVVIVSKTKKQQGQNLFSLDSTLSKRKPSNVKVEMSSWKGSLEVDPHSRTQSTKLEVREDSIPMIHTTQVQYQPSRRLDLDSKTIVHGDELLNVDSRIQSGRSHLQIKTNAPKILEPMEGILEFDPSNQIKTGRIHLKKQMCEHTTKIQLDPEEMLALESNTQHQGRRLFKLDSRIAPATESFLDIDTEPIQGNIKVVRHTIPRTLRFELNGRQQMPVNHLTNIEYTPCEELNVVSNTKHSGQEIAAISTKISSRRPSQMVMDIVPLKATFQVNPFGQQKTFHYDILKKDGQIAHSSSLEMHPTRMIIKSQASAQSQPIYSMDSELNSQSKSHFNLDVPDCESTFEVDPFSQVRSTRFVLNGKSFPHQHSTQISLGDDDLTVNSETSKQGRKVFKIDSLISRNDRSHMNLESSLLDAKVKVNPWARAPNGEIQIQGRDIPLEHYSNLDLQPGKVLLKTKTSYQGQNLLDMDSQLKSQGESRVKCATPLFDGDFKVHPQEQRFSVDYLAKHGPRDRRILCSSMIKSHPKNKLDLNVEWDADRDQEKKIKISMDGEQQGQNHRMNIRGEMGSTHLVNVKTILGKDLIHGPHEIDVEINIPKHPVHLIFEHQMKNDQMRCAFRYIRDGQEKAELVHLVKMQQTREGYLFDASLKGVSVYKWIDGLNLQVQNRYMESRRLVQLTSALVIQLPDSEPYKINSEFSKSSTHGSQIIGTIKAETPIYDYKDQEITGRLAWNQKEVQMNGKMAALGKSVEMEAKVGNEEQGIISQLKVQSTFEQIPNAEVEGQLKLFGQTKKVLLTADVNRRRKVDIEGQAQIQSANKFNGQLKVDSDWTKKYDLIVRGDAESQRVNYEFNLKQNNQELVGAILNGRQDRNGIQGKVQLSQERSELFSVNLKTSKVSNGQTFEISYNGPVRPTDVTFTTSDSGRELRQLLKVCPQGVPCLEFQMNVRNDDSYSTTDRSAQLSFRRKNSEYKLNYLLQNKGRKSANRLIFDFDGVKVGYNAELVQSSSRNDILGQVFLPERTMEVRGTTNNGNKKQMELEFLADAKRQPNRKLKVEIQHQNVENGNQRKIKSQMIITHPVWQRPLSASFNFNLNPNNQANPLSTQLTVDVTSDPSKKLIYQADVLHPRGDDRNTTVQVSVQHQDKQDLDIGATAHLALVDDVFSTGLNWHWVNRYSERLQGHHMIKINSQSKQVLVVSRCPMNKLMGKGEWEVTPRAINVNGQVQLNGESQEAQMKLTTDEKPCAILSVADKKWSACIDTTGKNILNMTLSTPQEGKDLSFAFYQHGDRVYRLHLNWRPEAIGELIYAAGKVADAKVPVRSYDLAAMSRELRHKMRALKSTIHQDVIRPSSQAFSSEMQSLKDELSIDDQYLQPIHEAGSMAMENLEKVQQFIVQLLERILPESFQRVAERMSENVSRYMTELCAYESNCYAYAYKYQQQGLSGIRDQLNEDVEEVVKSMKLSNIWNKIQQWSQRVIDNIVNSDLVKKVEQIVAGSVRMGEETIQGVIEKIEKILGQIDDSLESNPEIRDMYRNLKEMAQNTQQEIQKSLRNVDWKKVSNLNDDVIKFLTSPEVWQTHAKFLTWNLEDGEVLVEFRPPMHPATLKSIWKPKHKSPIYTSFQDKMATIQSAINSEWLPPFSGQAMLIGGQHFITFDGHTYDFASSSCRYILAKDPKNPSFSVEVQYKGYDSNGQIRKSIIVQQNDRTIELMPQKKTVKLNGNAIELPLFLEQGLSVRRENQAIVLQSGNGMRINVNLKQDLVIMTLNRWQFNKMHGMFGSFDHEPKNDMKTPNGRLVTRPQDLAKAWEAGSCRSSQNLARVQMARPESEAFRMCQRHFTDDESTLRGAFSVLEPKAYFDLCLRHAGSHRDLDPRKALCSVAAGYQQKAKFFGVEVNMPSTCLSCERLEFGERMRHRPSYGNRNADVIFVVEEDSCNRHLVKQIDTLSRLLERDLRSEGFSDTQFGVVSFGQDQKEMMRTARGETMFPARDILLAIEGMQFHNRRANNLDNLEALLIASEYGWRKGASKNLVLLTCNQCKISDYSVVQHLFLERGITLHVVNEAPIEAKSASSSKSRYFFGLDAKAVYDLKSFQSRNLEGQTDLRSQVRPPKDVCVALAQESGGSFFSSQLLVKGKALEQKQWRSLFSQRIVKSAQPDNCQRCDCAIEPDQLSSRTICRPCRPWKPVY